MSINQSNLSSTGFDYVVAVTQDSINATLEEYLYSGLPEVILCYVYDNKNNPTPIAYATLVANANNTDPFAVPDGTPSSDQRVQNLNNANFAFAIKAKLGLPPGVAPASLPPIVALKPGQSNVTYTLMFSEFVATELLFGPRGSITWFNQSQPSGTPWTFTGAVDLNFQDAAFENLPAAVQNQIKGLQDEGATFSIQQLYYDLNSSDLEQGFQFNNLPSNSNLNTFMTADFVNTYWKALGGASVLGYGANQTSATPASTFAVTDLSFFTPDAAGTEGAPLTLNYLCATNNDALPDTTHAGFGWNWIEPGEVSQCDGVVAINRNTLANYFIPKLASYVIANCYYPKVTVTLSGAIPNYDWKLIPNNSAKVTIPPSGPTVLSFSYGIDPIITSFDQAGAGGGIGRMRLSTSFTLDVAFSGNTITITQHLVLYLMVRRLATQKDGNIIDKTITDTYTIAVDENGALSATLSSSKPQDNSEDPRANPFMNFWAPINKIIADVTNIERGLVATNLTDIPVSALIDFVFPGGKTFVFKDACFSDNQDLIAHITYADPS